MSWSPSVHRGSNNNKTSGVILTVSPTATLAVGAVVVAVCVSDNVTANGAQTETHAVTDFKGNTWTKIREHTNSAAVAAGITGSVWITQITSAILTTDIIVFGLSAAAAAKAIGLYETSVDPGKTFRVVGKASSEQDNTASPSVTLNGGDGSTNALFGVCFREADTANTYAQDADYNDRTKFGTTGGTAATNVSCIVGDRVAALTSDTFAPTALSAAADVVTILCALQEIKSPLATYLLDKYKRNRPDSHCNDLANLSSALFGGNKVIETCAVCGRKWTVLIVDLNTGGPA